ncbi:MAG: hypothetical protein PHP79_08445, partial [Clostridia bacterium]|nr:hypothetical protein [Clostridia bacterium]
MYNIQEAFRDGVKGYTPSTMWFTSGNINKNEMTYQIEGFKREGIEDYFIHPSNGTQGDYLGEYFFCMIKHAAAEAKRLGINFWIYDEYNWPSGVAGGQVLLDEPWTHSSCLCKITVIAAAGETIEMMLPEKKRFNTTPLLFIVDGAEAVVVLDGDVVTWTNDSAEEKSLEVYFSKWTLGKIAALRDSGVVAPVEGYLDTLDPEAVSVFINKTHEEYKKHIGEGFGEYVKGIFTDEVVTSYLARQKGEEEMIMLPWTRLFLDKFIERNSYDIRPRLSELFSNTSPKLNVDYWETVSDLFMDAFMSMTYDWCTENKLIYTGHINGEESIQYNVFISGDPYEYYKRFTWPGIDTICTYYRMNDYSYNITAKLASSAAHFLGKERVLSETFTISGWDIRLRDMKRVF